MLYLKKILVTLTLAKNDNVGENAGKNYQVKLSWENSDLQN